MEEKEKKIIDRNEELLVRNIVLTPEFYELLQTYNVLPVTMVTDIRTGKSKEEKNCRLLKTLKLRGCDAFRKLCHILSLTGHAFLADHLHEEETDTKLLRSEEFFGKFPTVFNHISDDIKTKVLQYLETKLKEKMLVNTWVNSTSERSELMESRKLEFEHERELRTKMEKYKRQLSKAVDDLALAKDELKQNRLDMKIQLREVEESEKRFKQELGVQSRFNAANNSSVLRLREQFTTVNTRIRQLNCLISDFLYDHVAETTQENTVTGAMLTILEKNIRTLMDKADQHAETLDRSSNERNTILSLLRKPMSRSEPLSEIVRKHVEKENKTKLAICQEMEKLNESLRDVGAGSLRNGGSSNSVIQTTDLKLIRNMIATFRVEAEHLRKKLNWKDAKISDLVEELRQKPVSLRPIEDNPLATGDVFFKSERELPAHSEPKGGLAKSDGKMIDSLTNQEKPTLYSTRRDKWSRESSPLKPISIVTESTDDNDTDENQSRLISSAQRNVNIDDNKSTLQPIDRQLNQNIIIPRSPQVQTSVDHTNIATRKKDGDTMAIQEVTSYMEEKIAEGKLPPIVPNSSYLNFENAPSIQNKTPQSTELQ
ncbi:uncharacterized protein LOC132556836 [Ylistrum balloti]|uniref:uncharacterized protein LOC132556836 n=1 Tax=Ylistrum balloti TaxID=509963 RepID=UPI002905D66D|nr:uncharacterized protein LOC132556836 [Ylistrum balloti]